MQIWPSTDNFYSHQKSESFANITSKVKDLWLAGSKLRNILRNFEIFVCLVNKLIPLLNKPARFTKLLNKVMKNQVVNSKSKILKKLSGLLVKLKVCEKYLLTKVSEKIQVNFTNLENQPIINLQINNIHFTAILDTGSSFTIIPDKHIQQLKTEY